LLFESNLVGGYVNVVVKRIVCNCNALYILHTTEIRDGDPLTIYYRHQVANPYQVGNVAQKYYNNTTTLSQFQALGGVTQVNDVISDWSQSMGVSSTRFGDGTQQMTWFFIVYPSGNVAYRIAIWYYTSNNDTDARNGAGRTDTFTNMNEIDL